MSPQAAALEAGVLSGLRFVTAQLGPSGQWPSRRHERADRSDEGRHETSPCVTGLGVLALAGVDHPLAGTVRRRSLRHLAGTMQPSGLWRYYRDIPIDVDTSSIAALAVEGEHPWLTERLNVPLLLDARARDGRFRIWLMPGEPILGEVDAVVNANAVAVLGERPETEGAVRWIAEVVEQGFAGSFSWYYRDGLDLALAVQRAVDSGVSALRSSSRASVAQAVARLQDEAELSAHRLGQAIIAASWGASSSIDATLARAQARLLGMQRSNGSWPAGLLYVGAAPPDPPTVWFSSEAVTTALCIKALAVAYRPQRDVENSGGLL